MKRLKTVRAAYRGHCTRAVKAASGIMESHEPDLKSLENTFEGLCSRMEQLSLQNQKIELAVAEDKIDEEIMQTLEYTDELTVQKNKTAKFLREAKAQMKHLRCFVSTVNALNACVKRNDISKTCRSKMRCSHVL